MLRYTLEPGSGLVTGSDVTGAAEVTNAYLLDFFRFRFGDPLGTVIVSFLTRVLQARRDVNVADIEYRSFLFGNFAQDSTLSTALFNQLITVAFSGINGVVYVNRLRTRLPTTNVFQRTISVVQIPGFLLGGSIEDLPVPANGVPDPSEGISDSGTEGGFSFPEDGVLPVFEGTETVSKEANP